MISELETLIHMDLDYRYTAASKSKLPWKLEWFEEDANEFLTDCVRNASMDDLTFVYNETTQNIDRKWEVLAELWEMGEMQNTITWDLSSLENNLKAIKGYKAEYQKAKQGL